MENGIETKIGEKYGKIIDELSKIPQKDIRSILIYLTSNISNKVDELILKNNYNKDRFVQPAKISQQILYDIENKIYNIIPEGFEGVEFSPVNPIGLNSFLTSINQKNILSNIRLTETVADSTTLMALEASKRREKLIKQSRKDELVKLCTIHRFLRAQYFSEELKFLPHFKMFTFSTAGRKNCGFKIEKQTLQEHIQIYIDIMNLLLENGYHLNNITFLISDIRILEKLMKEYDINRSKLTTKTTDLNYSFFGDLGYNINGKVNGEDLNNLNIPILNDLMLGLKQLNEKLICDFIEKNPNISFKYDLGRLAGMGYYDSYCFKVLAKNQDNLTLPLVDAGFSNWTRKLLRNEKEFYFSSGFGLELFLENFKK